MTQIKDALLDFNPWWKGEFKVEGFKDRAVYRQLLKFMPAKQILALTGLRRVGKTTLLLKLAEDSIGKGLNPKNVLYFSFDEFSSAKLRQVLNEYEELVGKDLRAEQHLILLDEVQKLEQWADQVKTLYDLFGKRLKILVSGSESLFIASKSKEALAGRLFEFAVEPLSFKEFLGFKGITFELVELYRKELARLLEEFIITLGFPELIGIEEKAFTKKYVEESIVEKVLYRDFAELFSIKDISVVRSLLDVLLNEPGQLVELSELARVLGISRQTVSQYLAYLEQSFLVRKLYNFSISRRKVERKLKKYYPTLLPADLLFKNDEVSRSKVFECLIVNQLKAEFFWRDPYKNEVDVVIADGKPTPVEVKYGKLDFEGLLAFMKRFKLDEGYIVSANKEETHRIGGKTIHVVPAFKFLLKNPARR